MNWIVFAAVLWVTCGVVNFGLMFAYFQREYRLIANDSWRGNFVFSLFGSFFGPLALFATFVVGTYGHGFKYNFKPEGITWEEYSKLPR